MPREVNTPLLLTGAAATSTDPRAAMPKSYIDAVAAPISFVDTQVNYTAKPGEYVLADAINGPITITLSSGTSGVKKVDAGDNVVTVAAAAGNTIGSLGAASFPLRMPDQALVATVRGVNHAITHGYSSLQQLDRRFARNPMPALAGPRAGSYERSKNLYLPSGSCQLALRAALSKAAAGSLVNVGCIGDSKTAGHIAGPQNAWPAQLRALLTAWGVPSAGTGLVPIANNGTRDSRWTATSGTWTDNLLYATSGSASASKTFTSDVAGTVLEIYYFNTSAAFTYQIGAATAVTVTPTGAATVGKTTVTGQSIASGTTIKITASSATPVYLVGVCVRNTSGVLLHNLGIVGATSGSWTSTAAGQPAWIAQSQSLAADMAVIGIGSNDAGNSVAPATFASNLAAVWANFASAARFGIVETPRNEGSSPWSAYVPIIYDQADTSVVPLLDMTDRWKDANTPITLGMIGSDNLHDTAAGYSDVARALRAAWL